VQAANAIIAMAAGIVTNCRISHFPYEARAMMLAQLLEKHGLGARSRPRRPSKAPIFFRLETSGIVMVCLSRAKSDAVAISLGGALKFCLDEAHKASHHCSSGSLCGLPQSTST
jgi:hypothetical protein